MSSTSYYVRILIHGIHELNAWHVPVELSAQLIPSDIDVMIHTSLETLLHVLNEDSRVIKTSVKITGLQSSIIRSLPTGITVIREHVVLYNVNI
jgi:hypothetical protein